MSDLYFRTSYGAGKFIINSSISASYIDFDENKFETHIWGTRQLPII